MALRKQIMGNMTIRQAVVLAGGLGTRMKPFTFSHPKPMYPFGGKPFIAYLVEQIRGFGIRDILILLGYMPEDIMDYLKDGSEYGVNISYDITPVEYNTGGRLLHALGMLERQFLLMYCDNYCPIDFPRLVRDYEDGNAFIQLSAYENKDGYTKSNLLVEGGKVKVYDKKRTTPNLQGVDIGYAIINKDVFQFMPRQDINFEEVVYAEALRQGRLSATMTKHRYYSVGSWERLKLTEQFLNHRPTVFLDRDGTVNEKAPKACYIENEEQFIWLEGAKEAIKILKSHDYRIIMITNQPGIARGNLSEEGLLRIHKKMEADLAEAGTSIDRIYYCPHNWDEGCECRKPKPGMLYQAQKDYSLDLTKCILIGDDDRDIEAGCMAGCRTYQVTEGRNLLQIVKELVKEK